jgi:hypothetical protein
MDLGVRYRLGGESGELGEPWHEKRRIIRHKPITWSGRLLYSTGRFGLKQSPFEGSGVDLPIP